MTSQIRYMLRPEQVITALLRAHPETEAMERAVGGDYTLFGVLEHAVLRESAGLRPESSVIDVGCGSGRLAVQLAQHAGLSYLGTDIVPALLEHARQRAARPDFRFINIDRINIPAADESADIVCFFSVMTHLLHEESYLYLLEAMRVLKPGGRIVFSFLEYDTPIGWTVFEANLDWVRSRVVASQLNIFLHRRDIQLWARRLGLRVEMLRGGEPGSVTVEAGEAVEGVPAGSYAFGQSLCVLRKPMEGEPPEPARPNRERGADARPARQRDKDKGPGPREGQRRRDKPERPAGATPDPDRPKRKRRDDSGE